MIGLKVRNKKEGRQSKNSGNNNAQFVGTLHSYMGIFVYIFLVLLKPKMGGKRSHTPRIYMGAHDRKLWTPLLFKHLICCDNLYHKKLCRRF